ncbi:MAG: hypothetical protein AAF351_00465 [Pseudomonadota bacterium]
MSIPTSSGQIASSELFKLVWRGWFIGVLVIMGPLFALGALISAFGYGEWELLIGLILVPLIAAGQGVVAGVLVLFGLKVSPPKAAANE